MGQRSGAERWPQLGAAEAGWPQLEAGWDRRAARGAAELKKRVRWTVGGAEAVEEPRPVIDSPVESAVEEETGLSVAAVELSGVDSCQIWRLTLEGWAITV